MSVAARRSGPRETGDTRAGADVLPIADLRRDLLAWYRQRRRALPWREQTSLYGTWVSEIMLQQTTVAAVVPYWTRFLARFPDVQALAAAPLSEVLAHWSGLGYYRRGRTLHEAARRIVAERGGDLPRDAATWRQLPGVGPYTAGAIASIGLGECVPAVDANARRVILRWLASDPAAARAYTNACIADVAAELVDPGEPGDWNQAVMELGATVCRARDASCACCPVRSHCRAGRGGDAGRIGVAAATPKATAVVTSVLGVVHRGQLLLVGADAGPADLATALGAAVRSDFATLHQGLLSLPHLPWFARPADFGRDELLAVWRRWLDDHSCPEARISHSGRFQHAVTRYRLVVEVVRAAVPDACVRPRLTVGTGPGIWATLPKGRDRLAGLPLSTLAQRSLRSLKTESNE